MRCYTRAFAALFMLNAVALGYAIGYRADDSATYKALGRSVDLATLTRPA